LNQTDLKIGFMDEHNDVRWKQRFDNYEKAMVHLELALQIQKPDVVHRAGLIQFFEMSFELSWNVMKDYLTELGYTDAKSPRAAIKKAFETGLIEDGYGWIKLLEDRNLTSHVYDDATAIKVEELIRNEYYALLKKLYSRLKTETNA
jgi:nucleotidyltransferase substrate binding protein (TIGR01987 family)